MIFVSTSCIKSEKVFESINILAKNGIRNIELSGGTNFYENYLEDLLQLKKKFKLNYLVHNYFPPPKKHFIINLASLNIETFNKTLDHCINAISLCKKLGVNKYGIHAGFLLDIKIDEIGKKVSKRKLFDKEKSIKKFCEGWMILKKKAGNDIELYIENNVFSYANKKEFNSISPLLFTNYENYLELKQHINFSVLLDLAHLKVSCKSLNKNFNEEAHKLLQVSEYCHVSGNDGFADQNTGINNDFILQDIIKKNNFKNKIVTLEVYDGEQSLKDSLKFLEENL